MTNGGNLSQTRIDAGMIFTVVPTLTIERSDAVNAGFHVISPATSLASANAGSGARCIILLAVLLSGCATKIEHNGFRFTTYSNAARMIVTAPGVRFEAMGLNNSLPTATAFRGATQALGVAGTTALPFSNVPGVLKAAPIIPATGVGPRIPEFRTGASRQ